MSGDSIALNGVVRASCRLASSSCDVGTDVDEVSKHLSDSDFRLIRSLFPAGLVNKSWLEWPLLHLALLISVLSRCLL